MKIKYVKLVQNDDDDEKLAAINRQGDVIKSVKDCNCMEK